MVKVSFKNCKKSSLLRTTKKTRFICFQNILIYRTSFVFQKMPHRKYTAKKKNVCNHFNRFL